MNFCLIQKSMALQKRNFYKFFCKTIQSNVILVLIKTTWGRKTWLICTIINIDRTFTSYCTTTRKTWCSIDQVAIIIFTY